MTEGTIFDYAITPASFPCGGPGGAAEVTLTLVVSNKTGAAQDCEAIQFTLPAGLSDDLGSIGAAVIPGTPWQIAPQGDGVFVAEPQPPATGIAAGDAIGFVFSDVRPSATPATVELAVEEAPAGGTTQLTLLLTQPQLGITQFTASAVQATPGAAVTLSWDTSSASSSTLSWDRGTQEGAAQGSFTDHLPATTTYTLTASGVGEPVQAQLTVTVQTPQILSFGASPGNATKGAPVTLTWETLHADECTLTFHPQAGPESPPVNVSPNSSGYVEHPLISGVYHLQAVGEGRTVSSDQPVTVEDVVIDSFSPSPAAVDPGGSSTLSWSTQWASAVEIDQGVGLVATSGNKAVTVASDTVYTLSASGFNPQIQQTAVAVPPRITGFHLNVGSDQVLVSWNSAGAATATLGGVAAGPNDTVAVSPNAGEQQLMLTSPHGYSAGVAFTVTARPLEVRLDLAVTTLDLSTSWPPLVAFDLTSPAGTGINLPGSAAIAWNDQLSGHDFEFRVGGVGVLHIADGEEVNGSATDPAGASSVIGPNTSGQVALDVQAAAAGSPSLWAGNASGTLGFWQVAWRVLPNMPPGG